jgi:hypothetical protein
MQDPCSLVALLTWLVRSGRYKLVNSECIHELQELCAKADESCHSLKSCFGLEVHRKKKYTDLCLFGGPDLLRIQGINYPNFARKWLEFSEPHTNLLCEELAVEFDYSKENGYSLMGFFVRFPRTSYAIKDILESIRFYSVARSEELDHEIKEVYLPAIDDSLRGLDGVFKAVGLPHLVGYVDRNICAVKIIIEVTKENISKLSAFTIQRFGELIVSSLGYRDLFGNIMRYLLSINSTVRLSVDYDILSSQFIQRLSLECIPARGATRLYHCRVNSSDNRDVQNLLFRYFPSYTESLALEQCLPHVERRPSFNLVDDEYFCIHFSHRKFVISEDSAEVKDYVLVSSDQWFRSMC